jgi:membrane associated rhomboid family serine protease
MIIPLRTDSPLRTTPYMNWAIIAANVIVFLMTLSNPHATDPYALSARSPQLFQFFTYQFLHGGWLHLIGNMLFLYIFGNNVNDRLGNVGYLALYLAGGVFAGISYIVTSNGEVGLIGASGSIATITGAYLVLLPRSNITIVYFFYLVGVTEIASIWFILGFFAYDIFLNFSAHDNVGHTAHIGGTIFGALLCIGLLAARLLPRDPFDVVALIQRWNRRRQYRDMVAGGYNPFEYTQPVRAGYFGASKPAPAAASDPRADRILEVRSEVSRALAGHNLDLATRLYTELKTLDPQQTLPKQQQLDVANHLAGQQLYPQAAEAYESFLQQYPKADQVAQVELMLGLIYARYLQKGDRAREYLTRAASKYHDGRELELAREELSKLAAGTG